MQSDLQDQTEEAVDHYLGKVASAPETASVAWPPMIGRIPILDVEPQVSCHNGRPGLWPAKASTGETFEVSATVFREGHETLAAGVVLRDPSGALEPLVYMDERAPGTDRLGAEVTVGEPGLWHFRIEARADPLPHLRPA